MLPLWWPLLDIDRETPASPQSSCWFIRCQKIVKRAENLIQESLMTVCLKEFCYFLIFEMGNDFRLIRIFICALFVAVYFLKDLCNV